MKKKVLAIFAYVQMFFAVVAVICGLIFVATTKEDWLYTLFIYIITILASVLVFFLFRAINNKNDSGNKNVFISYTSDDEAIAIRIKDKIPASRVILGEKDIPPGVNIEQEARRYIANSSYCFILIGHKMSPQQKYEIKEMLRTNKKIIPIKTSSEVKIPSNLKMTKSILVTDYLDKELRC